jgi:outer membrane protein
MNLYIRFIVIHIIIMIIALVSQDVSASDEYSLEDLYRIALERSEKIKISGEEVYVSESGKDKALSALLPKFSAFWDYTRYTEQKFFTQAVPPFVIQPQYSATWGLRLDQSVSLSGREITAFKISQKNIEKSNYDLSAVRENYLFEVSSAYYDVLRAKSAVEIAESNVERLAKHRDAAAIRLKAGEVTKTALLRAQAELSGARSELVKAENSLKLARAILARLVGLNDDYKLKGAAESSDLGILAPDNGRSTVANLRGIAMSERAELKAIGLQKEIADDQVKYARGTYWPSLSIEGVYSRLKVEPSSPFFIDETIYGALNLNFPFFEGGLRRAEVRESEARQRQAVLALEDLKKDITIEVENAYLDFMTQKGVLKSLEDQLTFAKDNYNAVSRQFEFGFADSIEVMDANTLLVTAGKQLANAKYDYQLSILRVERASGTLLKTVMKQQSPAIDKNVIEE